MKKNLNFMLAFLTLLFIGCNNPSEKHLELEAAQASLEKNLEMYTMVWDAVFKDKNLDMINEEYFDKDVVAVATTQGDVVGIENFKAYYSNYITGFSDGELIFVDLFGQGDKIVKHWRFKGTHDGDFMTVSATGKTVDISGTTLVKMKDGKIVAEQDFLDLLSFYTQLGIM